MRLTTGRKNGYTLEAFPTYDVLNPPIRRVQLLSRGSSAPITNSQIRVAPYSSVIGSFDSNMATYKILVGSHTDSIYTLEFDPAPLDGTPTLKLLSQVNVGHHPSWIEAHPSDRSLIFTGLEQTDGQIAVIKYDKDCKGQKIDEATSPSGGADPCTLRATEHELIVGNVSPFLPWVRDRSRILKSFVGFSFLLLLSKSCGWWWVIC